MNDKEKCGVEKSNTNKINSQDAEFPKGKNSSKNSKKFGKGRKFDKSAKHFEGNDPAWWKKYPMLMDVAAKFSWRSIPGLKVIAPTGGKLYYNVNGMAVEYCPVIGINDDASSPVNMVFRDLWLQMHKQYRGLGKYEQADLACIIIAIAGFFANIAEAERIYGLIRAYLVQNRAIPVQVLRAVGVEKALQYSLETNLANFRYGLNMLITKAKQLLIPKQMTALYNWISLNANVYKDGDANNAQFIAFRPSHRIVYNTLTSSGSCLEFDSAHSIRNMVLYSDILDALNTQLQVLVQDEDIAIVCSDLLAFYGEEQVEYLQPLPEDYIVIPIKDDNILLKLHNASGAISPAIKQGTTYRPGIVKISNAYPSDVVADLPTSVTAGENFIVYQKDNNLHSQYYLSFDARSTISRDAGTHGGKTVYVCGLDARVAANQDPDHMPPVITDRLLDTWSDDPKPDEFMEATLWCTPVGRVKVAGTVSAYNVSLIQTCATELITRLEIINKDPQFDDQAVRTPIVAQLPNSFNYLSTANRDSSQIFSKGFTYLSKIDWAPFVYVLLAAGSVDSDGDYIPYAAEIMEPIGDTTNFKWVTVTDVRLVHDCAVLSGFTMNKTTLIM